MAQQAKIEDFSGTEVITLTEAKDYLRVDTSDDNDYITELIKIARMQVLKDTNTSVVDLDVTEYFDKWPNDGIFQLRYSGKLGTNIVFKYYNPSDSLTTITEGQDFRRVDYMGMPKIEMINTFTLKDRLNAIEIKYSVEPENSDETRTLKIAMYMLIQHYYDNRSPVSYLKVDEMPLAYKHIITQYKNYIW